VGLDQRQARAVGQQSVGVAHRIREGHAMTFDDDTTEAHERRITRCRDTRCNARIIWLKTVAGKNMPVDADTVEASDDVYDAARHTSHFKTCPGANKFSGRNRS
jgi:hypothetical protein